MSIADTYTIRLPEQPTPPREQRRPQPVTEPAPRPVVHGWPRYCKYGCRCDICLTASADYRAQRAARGDRPSTALGIPAWMEDAACTGKPSDVFFRPDSEGSGHGRKWSPERAKAICATCPVRERCEGFALTEGIVHGVWGGKTEEERRKMRRPA